MTSEIIQRLQQHNRIHGLPTQVWGHHVHSAVRHALEHQKITIPSPPPACEVCCELLTEPLGTQTLFDAEIAENTPNFIKNKRQLPERRHTVFKAVAGRIENWHGHHILYQADQPLYEHSSALAPLRLMFVRETLSRPPVAHLKSVFCFFNGTNPRNYCHFFVDWISRVHAIRQIPASVDTLVFPEFTQLAFHSSFFTRLQAWGFHIFFLKPGDSLEADNLYFVTYGSGKITGHPAFNCHRDTLSFLRDFWSAPHPPKTPTRDILWISRPQSRRLLEERAVMERLQKRYSLTCVDFSDIPPPQQAEWASTHRAMVGVHGAGFTNLCFLPPSSKVLEIFCKNNGTPAFQLMATAMGHGAYAYVGQRVEQSHPNYPDIHVDPDRLVSFIDSVMNSSAPLAAPSISS